MPSTVKRAKRFALEAAVAFRERGEPAWSMGRSVNVSRTGVLFETDKPTNIGATIELVLEFSAPVAAVACSGRVIRTTGTATGHWTIAATISRYSLLPTDDHDDE